MTEMKILLVAATQNEFDWLGELSEAPHNRLVTGIGILNTAVSLTKYLSLHKTDLIIQVGIAGTLNPDISIGSAVTVSSECLPELGVMENAEFISAFDMGLLPNSVIYNNGLLINPYTALLESTEGPLVRAGTVMEISTDKNRIARFREKNQMDIESMEGAALHQICLELNIPFIQIRGISNVVGDRNKKNWQFNEPMVAVKQSVQLLLETVLNDRVPSNSI
jgi:futalosine hydrolase